MFLLSKTKCGTYSAQLSFEAKVSGKRKASLNGVGIGDPSNSDEGMEDLTVDS